MNDGIAEERYLGRKGVMVQEDDLATAWSKADAYAKSVKKVVIQNEYPPVIRRLERLHYFFPYSPTEI